MSSGHADDERADRDPHTWVSTIAHGLHHIGSYGVDVAAIVALYGLATSGAAESTVQVLGTAIVSVALGKRYAEAKFRGA